MFRPSVCLVAIAVVFGLASATPTPRDRQSPAVTFPTAVGTKWVYEGSGDLNWEVVEIISSAVEKDGATTLKVDRERIDHYGETSFSRKSSELRKLTPEGLFAMSEEPDDEPSCLFRLPHRVGNEWETGTAGGTKVMHTAGKTERVEVPAGVYQAVRMDVARTCRQHLERHTEWYVSGIGRVKIEGRMYELVLKSFTPGKR